MSSAVRNITNRRKPPGTFHHGALREALVSAATDAVIADGHNAVSLRQLASSLGVSQPAVYRHFASREALLLEVTERAWVEFSNALKHSMHDSPPGADAIRNMGRTYVRWAHQHPNLFRLMSSRIITGQRSGPLPTPPREYFHAGLGGAVPIDDPHLHDAFRATWAVAHGLATFVVERVFQLVDSDDARIEAADGAIDCYVDMLRARWPTE